MHIERKITVVALAALIVTASFALAQSAAVSPAGKGSGQAVAQGSFSGLNNTPMQQCLMDLITWEQSLAHDKLGGSSIHWDTFTPQVKDARMEVIRACNLYHRATLTAAQQQWYDKHILDPKGHPLPAKWETMRLKGTLVSSLLRSDESQQAKAQATLDRFRDRNHAIWGTGHKNGGYKKNHDLLLSEFRAILNKEQLAEFNRMWAAYTRDVAAAVASVNGKP